MLYKLLCPKHLLYMIFDTVLGFKSATSQSELLGHNHQRNVVGLHFYRQVVL